MGRNIFKGAPLVAVQVIGWMLARREAGKARAVGDVKIHVAVAIGIEKRRPAHHTLDNVLLGVARRVRCSDTVGCCPVDELHGQGLCSSGKDGPTRD